MSKLKDEKLKDIKRALRIKKCEKIDDYQIIEDNNYKNTNLKKKLIIIKNKDLMTKGSSGSPIQTNDIYNNNMLSNIKSNVIGNKLNYAPILDTNQRKHIYDYQPVNMNKNPINNFTQNNNDFKNPQNPNENYKFSFKGLVNVGLTCYMNATLQCLLHVSELVAYFLDEYPKDCQMLKNKNQTVETRGEISKAFNELVKGVYDKNEMNNVLSSINSKTYPTYPQESFSPQNFKDVIGHFNPQFRGFSANDSKDLILYLLQTMHEELNYFGDNQNSNFRRPNQNDRVQTFMFFMTTYNMKNFSIISNIFYGTYEIITQCLKCNNIIYNFQRFEFISFGMFDYKKKEFNIYNGFQDNQKPNLLSGDNQFYCNFCKSLQDATTTNYIIQPPNKLIINIDYGKNKKFKPKRIKFDEKIDLTQYVKFDFGTKIEYKIIGVCTHKGESGVSGHYIAYCKHRLTDKWYKYNDSKCKECSHHEIYKDSPYLLLYERI
jgi:ubiquitin C-terminal hydrolase